MYVILFFQINIAKKILALVCSNEQRPLYKLQFFFYLSMTGPLTILTITLLVTIMFTGALTITPYAFSSSYSKDDKDDHDDEHDDDCDDDDHSKHGDEYASKQGYEDGSKHHDDDDDDCIPDPCDCKKPTELTVRYSGPGDSDYPVVVEIYKKTEKIGEKDPLVTIKDVYEPDLLAISPDPDDSNQIRVSASDFGKKKLGSNTGFRILWDDPADDALDSNQGLVEIARIDIHTSCSKLLYIGQTFTDGDVTLTVEDGTKNGKTSIPKSEPNTCEAEPKPTPTATIILKKAVTNDNGATFNIADFIPSIDGVPYQFDMEIPVDAGVPHMISENDVAGFSPVLIAGDTACPSMLLENFVLKKGQKITCTIYNDDDFIPGGGNGEPGMGVVFNPTSVSFTKGTTTDFTIPDGGGTVTINNINSDVIIVIDPAFQTLPAENLIVVYTLQDTTNSGAINLCFSEGIVDISGVNALRIACTDALGGGLVYALNYALINTVVLPPV